MFPWGSSPPEVEVYWFRSCSLWSSWPNSLKENDDDVDDDDEGDDDGDNDEDEGGKAESWH